MIGFLLCMHFGWVAFAQDTQPPPAQPPPAQPPPAEETVVNVPAPPEASPVPRQPVKRMNREKEAEGSEAKNRFTSDPVVKSQYRVGGQALEVDPD